MGALEPLAPPNPPPPLRPLGAAGAWLQGLRWGAVELGRRPLAWLAGAGFAALWPAVALLGPLGVTTRGATSAEWAFELGCLALLASLAFGVGLLARVEWSLERAAWGRRVAVEAGVLCGAAGLGTAAAVAPAVLLPRGVALADLAPGLPLAVAHGVAVGLVALRLPVGPGARALAVPLLAWVLPALPAPEGWLGEASTSVGAQGTLSRVLGHALDITRHGWPTPGGTGEGVPGLELEAERAHRWGALLPITALLGASCLLARRAPSAHALRHPR